MAKTPIAKRLDTDPFASALQEQPAILHMAAQLWQLRDHQLLPYQYPEIQVNHQLSPLYLAKVPLHLDLHRWQLHPLPGPQSHLFHDLHQIPPFLLSLCRPHVPCCRLDCRL